ncbi:MAG: single-stranded-DNA-specific exonuclease RecJ [Holosporales bacterium]
MTHPSFTHKHWHETPSDPRMAMTLAQRLDIPDVVARILAARGHDAESAAAFLEPRLKTSLPDPYHLRDMHKAVARLVQAIFPHTPQDPTDTAKPFAAKRSTDKNIPAAPEKIVVWGDYDVDGATSTSLLLNYFRSIGVHADYYIPDRQKEGYGPNAAALEMIARHGATLVITVDCGTTAFEPLRAAKVAGLDVIVLDHHLSEDSMPEAVAVVNPNRRDQLETTCRNLAAVGVCLLTLVALNSALEQAGFFHATGAVKPDLRQFLDIVALGTVADVVPLTGLNRAFVAQGLKIMAQQQNAGMRSLMTVSKLTSAPSAYHCGFLLGPRINAGGRVGLSSLGTQLLTSRDSLTADQIAAELDRLNQERQAIELGVLDIAMQQAEAQAEKPMIVVAASDWHEGVIGIVAGRIKEKFDRPTLCISLSEGKGKGSGRSAQGVHLGDLIISAKNAGLLTAGGGHAAAAGFSVLTEKLAEFQDYCLAQLASIPLKPAALHYDAVLPLSAATLYMAEHLEALAPFGMGNPQPRFLLSNVVVGYLEPVGKGHLRVQLQDPFGSARVTAMCFRAEDSGLLPELIARRGQKVDALVTMKKDTWNGNTRLGLFIEDVRAATASAAQHTEAAFTAA